MNFNSRCFYEVKILLRDYLTNNLICSKNFFTLLAESVNTKPREDCMNMPEVTFGELEIRTALRMFISTEYTNETDTVVIEELGLCRGQVRVDLVVVKGLLHGFEIKSDRDSLRRLAGQVDFYSRVLDRSTIVVGNRHFAKAMDIVPTWWGVLRCEPSSEELRFRTVRQGKKNPQRDPRSLVGLLWLDDAIALLEARDAARGIRGKPRRVVWDRVCEYFKVEEIADAVRASLKERVAMQALAQPL